MSPKFRKAALEKLSSPERLDSLMQVTTTKGWIALVAILVVIGGALVWGIVGSAPQEVGGSGILLRDGGIFNIEASGSGTIERILVNPGDDISQGDVIAEISLPDIDQRIAQMQQVISMLQSNRETSAGLVSEQRELTLQSIQEDIERLQKENASLQDQIGFLNDRLQAQQRAVELGLITNDQAQETAQQLAAAQTQIVGNQAQLAQLQSSQAGTRNSSRQQLFEFDRQIEEAQQQLDQLRLEQQQQSRTLSPYDGIVIDQLQDEGNIVQRGTPLITTELSGRDIEALIFVPLEGSRVRQGMTVKLSPNGIPWEQYGYILGTVKSVSNAPVGPVAMNRLLRNETLVQQLSAGGGAYLVTVLPESDSSTPTGFKWTSRQGPDMTIGTGTLFTGVITVDQEAPIALVIPALRRWLGF